MSNINNQNMNNMKNEDYLSNLSKRKFYRVFAIVCLLIILRANNIGICMIRLIQLPLGDTPYFFAYEMSYNGKHYIFEKCVSMISTDNGKHVDVVGYKYYCPEEDTYKIFENAHGMKRYYKFVIYKYFE